METYPSFPLVIITVNTSCIILGVKFTTCFKLYGVKLAYRDLAFHFHFPNKIIQGAQKHNSEIRI